MGKSKKSINKPFKRTNESAQTKKSSATLSLKPTPVDPAGKVSKKAKRLQKKSDFVTKLSTGHDAQEKIKKAKIRAQTAIVGDMDPLMDALTNIITDKKSKRKVKFQDEIQQSVPLSQKKKKIASEKSRHQANINDIALFQQVAAHPKFQADPLSAITDHVAYLLQKET